MSTADLAAEVARARAMRLRINLAEIDYGRELHRLAALGSPHEQLASAMSISQSGLSDALSAAAKIPASRPGFSGATPYELCQRFASGRITRAELIEELTRWDYTVPTPHEVDSFDDPRSKCDGGLDDIDQAFDDDLINDAIYDLVLDTLEGPQP